MPASTLNLTDTYRIEQGSTYRLALLIRDSDESPLDVSNVTFHAQVRRSYNASSAMITFTSEDIDAANGRVDLVATDEATAAATAGEGFVWDCEMHFADGTVRRILEGTATVTAEATKS